jgi:hypothetical protein
MDRERQGIGFYAFPAVAFGSDRSGRLDVHVKPVKVRSHAASCAHTLRSSLAALLVLAIAGCAQLPTGPGVPPPEPPMAPPIAPNVEPPPPAVNLSGFPLPYRQGYADGCASATGAERKDATRFVADGNYRTGWQDGIALCRRK